MQQRVICAAHKCPKTGRIICSVRHCDKLTHWIQDEFPDYLNAEWEQGFVDNKYQFLTREGAWNVAKAAGQIIRNVGCEGVLYSENLY